MIEPVECNDRSCVSNDIIIRLNKLEHIIEQIAVVINRMNSDIHELKKNINERR